ncbi:MAG: hypothetical protein ONB30_01290 [candidate division KSB1 bacterium]|nr:hypothetical protein [candidate division KSB1 bacterium]
MKGVWWAGMAALLSATLGCAHWTAVTQEQVRPQETVQVTLKSGSAVQGEIVANNDTYLVIRDEHGRAFRVSKGDIIALKRKPGAYDEAGLPISEREIAAVKGHRQLLLHALGGTALSFGISFYTGSMLQRGLQEDPTDNTLRIAVTSVGTAIGALFFAHKGDNRDRQLAIQQIRRERAIAAEQELEAERRRKAQVEAELERLRREQETQEREIEALRKQLEAQKEGKPRPPR